MYESKPYTFSKKTKTNNMVPKRYWDIMERMLNTKLCHTTRSLSYLTSEEVYGSGRIESQAGELMVVLSLVSDTVLDEIEQMCSDDSLVRHVWVDTARSHRDAVLSHIERYYGYGSRIVSVAWDDKTDIEELGFDYSQRSKTADIFVKVLCKRTYYICQVSLKDILESSNTKLLTTSPSYFSQWDSTISRDDIQVKYAYEQREVLVEFWQTKYDDVVDGISTNVMVRTVDTLQEKKKTIDDIGRTPESPSRSVRKILFRSIEDLSDGNDPHAQRVVESIKEKSHAFGKTIISMIVDNQNIRDNLLKSILDEFPLLSALSGKEVIVFGKYVCGQKEMQSIFKVTASKFTDHISFEKSDDGKVYMLFDGTFKICVLRVYEHGVGYGGYYRVDVNVSSDFTKALREVSSV